MARKHQELIPNKATGNYERLLGWKADREGEKPRQHKFYLGKERLAASIANQRLEKLWGIIEEEAGDRPPRWDWQTLEIGKAVAKGRTEYEVPRQPFMPPHNYVAEVKRMGKRFPIIACVPADNDYFAQGVAVATGAAAHAMIQSKSAIVQNTEYLKELNAPIPALGDTLHVAFDEYCEHLRKTVLTPPVDGEVQGTSSYGNIQIKNVLRLKEKHPECPLASVNLTAIQSMIDIWRNRPKVKGKTKPIARKVAVEHIKQLRNFFRWLHKNDKYEWRRPEDFADLVTMVPINRTETANTISSLQVDTYDVEEIALLYRYATPFERVLLLLGLNCGFGASEVGSLTVREVQLHCVHPKAAKIRFDSTEGDSFIMRIRRKTGVYGEWLLWPETATALEWAFNRRRKQTSVKRGQQKGKDISLQNTSLLLLSDDGTPLVKQTANGNTSNRIANLWATGLTKRIQKDHPSFRKLSFNKLRKTASDLIRHESDGEISGIFLTHGQPVKSDDLSDEYTNRPFAKVFYAIRAVRSHLDTVFSFQPTWPEERKKGGPNISIGKAERIKKLRSQGFKVAVIAEKVGVSQMTVRRHMTDVKDVEGDSK